MFQFTCHYVRILVDKFDELFKAPQGTLQTLEHEVHKRTRFATQSAIKNGHN